VRRGSCIQPDIEPSMLEDRGRELRRTNGGKVRGPCSHHRPESFMGLLAFLYSGSSFTPHVLGAGRGVLRFLSGFVVDDGPQPRTIER